MFQAYRPPGGAARPIFGYKPQYQTPQRRVGRVIEEIESDIYSSSDDESILLDSDSEVDEVFRETPERPKPGIFHTARRAFTSNYRGQDEGSSDSDSDVSEMEYIGLDDLKHKIRSFARKSSLQSTLSNASKAVFSLFRLLRNFVSWIFATFKALLRNIVPLTGILIGLFLTPLFGLEPWNKLHIKTYNGIEYRPVKSNLIDTTVQILHNISTIPTTGIMVVDLDLDPQHEPSTDPDPDANTNRIPTSPMPLRDVNHLVVRLARSSCDTLTRELSRRKPAWERYFNNIGLWPAGPSLGKDLAHLCAQVTKRELVPRDHVWDETEGALQSILNAYRLGDEILFSLGMETYNKDGCGRHFLTRFLRPGVEYQRCVRFLVETLEHKLTRGDAVRLTTVLPALGEAVGEIDTLRRVVLKLDAIRIALFGEGSSSSSSGDGKVVHVHRALRLLDANALRQVGDRLRVVIESFRHGVVGGITEVATTTHKMKHHDGDIPLISMSFLGIKVLEGHEVDDVWVFDTEDPNVREVVYVPSVSDVKSRINKASWVVSGAFVAHYSYVHKLETRLEAVGKQESKFDSFDDFVNDLSGKLDPRTDSKYTAKAKAYLQQNEVLKQLQGL